VSVERYWPSDSAARFVRHYWVPRWSLAPGETVRQDILEYPTANIVVEPYAAALHRAHRGRSIRMLADSGWAFGAMLRPGTTRRLVGASLRTTPTVVPFGALRVGDETLVARIRSSMTAGDDQTAVGAFDDWLDRQERPDPDAELVDAIVDAVENDRGITRVEDLADRFGLGMRRLQRLVAGHIGFGPKWLIQRYRLQEAAAALRSDEAPPLAGFAAELGYADQAHFGREFKAVVGATPGAYVAEAAAAHTGDAQNAATERTSA